MSIRARPRFEKYAQLEPDRFQQRLQEALDRGGNLLRGEVLEGHAQIMVSGPRRHTWSPCMSLTYTDVPAASSDGATNGSASRRLRVRGLFGPYPSLWTLIATLYCLSAFLGFFGAMVGWSQWLADQTPWGFVGIPAGLLLALILYGVSWSGQALARDQMDELREILEAALDDDSDKASANVLP